MTLFNTGSERTGEIYKKTLEEYEQPPLGGAIRSELDDYVARRRTELGDESCNVKGLALDVVHLT